LLSSLSIVCCIRSIFRLTVCATHAGGAAQSRVCNARAQGVRDP
jgi:hypothetical protein